MDIKFKNVTKSFGSLNVLNELNITFESQKVTSILGGSGVGKTTMLNILAGLIDYEGEIEGLKQNISYIFQEDRLIEHLTVKSNLMYVVSGDKSYAKKIDSLLTACDIINKKNELPKNLSGGQKQRVSIARAFLKDSDIMLLDEAFNSLDINIKYKLIKLFKKLLLDKPCTVINVTHDIDEAILISDRILVLTKNGVQLDVVINSSKDTRKLNSLECTQIRSKIYEFLTTT